MEFPVVMDDFATDSSDSTDRDSLNEVVVTEKMPLTAYDYPRLASTTSPVTSLPTYASGPSVSQLQSCHPKNIEIVTTGADPFVNGGLQGATVPHVSTEIVKSSSLRRVSTHAGDFVSRSSPVVSLSAVTGAEALSEDVTSSNEKDLFALRETCEYITTVLGNFNAKINDVHPKARNCIEQLNISLSNMLIRGNLGDADSAEVSNLNKVRTGSDHGRNVAQITAERRFPYSPEDCRPILKSRVTFSPGASDSPSQRCARPERTEELRSSECRDTVPPTTSGTGHGGQNIMSVENVLQVGWTIGWFPNQKYLSLNRDSRLTNF